MKPEDSVKKTIRESDLSVDARVHQTILEDALQRLEKVTCKQPVDYRPALWRHIMKNPITKLSMAAIIASVVFMVLFLSPLDTPAYGLVQAIEKLKDVQTLYIRSTQILYRENDSNDSDFETATLIPLEEWLDVPGLRESFTSWENSRQPDGTRKMTRTEGVHLADIALDIRHGIRTARFNKLSPVWRRLQMRDSVEQSLKIDRANLDRFAIIGQETIDQEDYDIWQWLGPSNLDPNYLRKIQYWVSRSTGYLGKTFNWGKNVTEEHWRLGYYTDEIKINQPIDEAVFDLEVPEGYKQRPPLEEAELGGGFGIGWRSLGGARICFGVSFFLDDGTIIVAWHSDDLAYDRFKDQSTLFADLKPGGDLPKLPMVISGIKTISLEPYTGPEVRYTGFHLAHTKKDKWYFEWAFYVPHEDPIPKGTKYVVYRQLCDFNLDKPQESRVGNPLHKHWIEASEFDAFVVTAMAELSDDGKAPEHVSYENLMHLVEKARESMGR